MPARDHRCRHPKATRSSSASPTACGRMRNPGKGCCSTLKRRGLVIGPELAIADGALGFWQAIRGGVAQDPRSALLKTKTVQRAQ